MTSDTKGDAIASLIKAGKSKSYISRTLGLPRSTVRYWADKIDIDFDASAVGTLTPLFLDQLAPIRINQPTRTKPIKSNSDVAVVIGDTHFGVECNKTIDVFYAVLDELKPGKIILNGDTVDLMAVSRYPKDVRYEVSLLDERVAYHKFLATVYDICGDVEIIETDANHSGNGVEGRWWRFLSERLGPLAALPDVIEKLSYQNVFIPEWADIDLVPYVELCNGNLFVMHGDIVRKQGGMSGRGMMDKWYSSIIMNHTHRIGMTSQRIPSIGSRSERSITVYENACACDLSPCYASAPNWQNGFSIVAMDGDSFGVEPLLVNNGVAVCTTLGKTIRV